MTPGADEHFGVYDFGLDTVEEDRAVRVHHDSIIVDMLFQGPCGYRSFDAAMLAHIHGGADVPPERGYLRAVHAPIRAALRSECDHRARWTFLPETSLLCGCSLK